MVRIAPLTQPWPAWFAEAMSRTMPPGVAPLLLFRVIGRSRRAWQKLAGGSLLDGETITLREREIVILRTTARCGCDYEWQVHAELFARRARLSAEQVANSAADEIDASLWSEDEATLFATVDALLERRALTETEFARFRAERSDEEVLEVFQLVGFYQGVSLICGALNIWVEAAEPE